MIPMPPPPAGGGVVWHRLELLYGKDSQPTSEPHIALIINADILSRSRPQGRSATADERWVIAEDGWQRHHPDVIEDLVRLVDHPRVHPVWIRPEPKLHLGYGGAVDQWEAIESDGHMTRRGQEPFGWWKHHAVLRWLKLTPLHLDTVVWIDPELSVNKFERPGHRLPFGDGETQPTLTHGDVAAVAIHNLGMRQLMVAPSRDSLSSQHVAAIESFLSNPGSQTSPALPEPPGFPDVIDVYDGDESNPIVCADCDPRQWWLDHCMETYFCPLCRRRWCADELLTSP